MCVIVGVCVLLCHLHRSDRIGSAQHPLSGVSLAADTTTPDITQHTHARARMHTPHACIWCRSRTHHRYVCDCFYFVVFSLSFLSCVLSPRLIRFGFGSQPQTNAHAKTKRNNNKKRRVGARERERERFEGTWASLT